LIQPGKIPRTARQAATDAAPQQAPIRRRPGKSFGFVDLRRVLRYALSG